MRKINAKTLYFFQIFEDIHLPERPLLEKTLNILNYFFAAVFSLEFILKILGLGVVKYFSSVWNCLDAFIVAVSTTTNDYPSDLTKISSTCT